MEAWYQKSGKDVASELGVGSEGLSSSEVDSRKEKYGLNRFDAVSEKSWISILLAQFKDVMIIILAGAAVVSFVVGEHTDAYVIIGIILGNALIGFFQEYNAEESMKKLQQLSAQHARVMRNNAQMDVDSEDLVPGDIVLIEAGNIVPADGRLLEISSLKTQEAILTGESHAVEKVTKAIEGSLELLPADQLNMVFKGTMVSNGSATMVVTETGMKTQIGRIAGMLDRSETMTPLQARLKKFSGQLVIGVLVICVIVFAYGLFRGEPPLSMFMTALSLAVAALPEALPAVVTIGLANGAARMVRQKALVRKLAAVETLGSVTYICSDKTGTLTRNEMTVEKVWAVEGKDDLLLHAYMLNNEVHIDHQQKLLGDPTEIALVQYALEQSIDRAQAEKEYPLIEKLPFDSDRMRMATLHEHDGKYLLLVKGAPARIAEILSSEMEGEKDKLLEQNRAWAKEGLRVLFFAYRILDQKPEHLTADMEQSLDFLGMVGMIDPPREEVVAAVKECREAGIRAVMITGDQPLTATAIAERLQLSGSGEVQVLTGADLSKMDDAELQSKVEDITVYARVSPEQKLKIVEALQNKGQFVAMTGDGVNDAPSLKQANIGIAMGITGSDVSKEAAHMILLDDNFTTIVKAVKEGRRIFDNIRKFIVYVLSCNLGEILVVFFAPVFGLPIPLLPIHILWINLVTDGLPGIALAAQPADKDVMKRGPRSPQEGFFAGGLTLRIAGTGVLMAVFAFILQIIASKQDLHAAQQQTMIFTFLCIVQLGNAISVTDFNRLAFTGGAFRNLMLIGSIVLTLGLQFLLIYVPFFQDIFKTETLSKESLWVTIGVSLACVIAIELLKLVITAWRKREKSTQPA